MKKTAHTESPHTTLIHSPNNAVTIEHGECLLFSYERESGSENFAFHFVWSSEFIPVVGKGKVKTSWRSLGRKSPDEFCLS